jgi:galactose mutarotase-like enzyme
LSVHVLKTKALSVEVLPEQGGRVASLKSLLSGVEFLTQSHRSGLYAKKPGLDAAFEDGPSAGIEECLPTVGPCGPDTPGGAAPDHGDFWQVPWDVMESSETHIRIAAAGFSRTLRFQKQIEVDGSALRIQYSVENTGQKPQSFSYACHPLFAVAAGDRIVLPPDIHELKLTYSRFNRLGAAGSILSWPVTQSGVQLDRANGPETGTADMFYTSRLGRGICGIYRAEAQQMLTVSFDVERLPCLGLWICYGGWPDQGAGPKQYAVALEPTTSACNDLAEAQRLGSAVTLAAGQSFDWEIRFEIGAPGDRPHGWLGDVAGE